jgi:hypothetical protein
VACNPERLTGAADGFGLVASLLTEAARPAGRAAAHAHLDRSREGDQWGETKRTGRSRAGADSKSTRPITRYAITETVPILLILDWGSTDSVGGQATSPDSDIARTLDRVRL